MYEYTLRMSPRGLPGLEATPLVRACWLACLQGSICVGVDDGFVLGRDTWPCPVTPLALPMQEAILQKGVDAVWHARLARGDPFEDPLQREQVRLLVCACFTAVLP
jgi:hypothetical protein